MSVNAVDLMELEPSSGPSTQRVLSPQLLRNEKMYFISKEGSVSFEFQSGEGYPGSGDNYISQSGTLYLSNFRTAYVCSPPILFDFKSFSGT